MGKNYLKSKKNEDLVVFPAKYADFQDVFDKHHADILLEHSHHNFAIDIENNKIPLFSSTYDYNRLKFNVLPEYINKIIAKRFIVLFKSLLKALILFTKKKNRGLRLCVDFYGLN